jgi:CheY-like chemotaxis protein
MEKRSTCKANPRTQKIAQQRCHGLVKLILVVGVGDPENYEILSISVLRHGMRYRLVYVRDGTLALRFTRNLKPDLLLLNHRPPAINAVHLYDQLHKQEDLSTVPAIVIGLNNARSEMKQMLEEMAARKLVGFPETIELDVLLTMIDHALLTCAD